MSCPAEQFCYLSKCPCPQRIEQLGPFARLFDEKTTPAPDNIWILYLGPQGSTIRVGMLITERPPDGSVRARLRIRLL